MYGTNPWLYSKSFAAFLVIRRQIELFWFLWNAEFKWINTADVTAIRRITACSWRSSKHFEAFLEVLLKLNFFEGGMLKMLQWINIACTEQQRSSAFEELSNDRWYLKPCFAFLEVRLNVSIFSALWKVEFEWIYIDHTEQIRGSVTIYGRSSTSVAAFLEVRLDFFIFIPVLWKVEFEWVNIEHMERIRGTVTNYRRSSKFFTAFLVKKSTAKIELLFAFLRKKWTSNG